MVLEAGGGDGDGDVVLLNRVLFVPGSSDCRAADQSNCRTFSLPFTFDGIESEMKNVNENSSLKNVVLNSGLKFRISLSALFLAILAYFANKSALRAPRVFRPFFHASIPHSIRLSNCLSVRML